MLYSVSLGLHFVIKYSHNVQIRHVIYMKKTGCEKTLTKFIHKVRHLENKNKDSKYCPFRKIFTKKRALILIAAWTRAVLNLIQCLSDILRWWAAHLNISMNLESNGLFHTSNRMILDQSKKWWALSRSLRFGRKFKYSLSSCTKNRAPVLCWKWRSTDTSRLSTHVWNKKNDTNPDLLPTD